MGRKKRFREPFLKFENGLYITRAQVQFFLNRERYKLSIDDYNKFRDDLWDDLDFRDYVETCKLYNLVTDLMEQDVSCADMLWSEKEELMVFTYPPKGKVARKIKTIIGAAGEEDVNDFLH